LIEGDATLAMALYVANNPLVALAFLKSLGTTGMASEELDKAPRALRESLLFPYQDGEKWVSALYKRGGWNEVSQAFTTLPQSTEQILHPEKYFAHEAPVKVTLPDIANLLNGGRGRGVPPVTHAQDARATWRRIAYDVQGEWGFYLILDQFLKSPAESRRAAAGWGGDRFAVYEGPNGAACIVSLSVWDTENDAREFFDTYVKRTELRYPSAEKLGIPVVTSKPTDASSTNLQRPVADTRYYETSEGRVVIELRGNLVAIVEGLPDHADAKSLLKLLW